RRSTMPEKRQRLVPGPRGVCIGFGEHDEISASAFYQAGGGRLVCAFLVVSLCARASGVPAAPIRRSTATSTNSTGEVESWRAQASDGPRGRDSPHSRRATQNKTCPAAGKFLPCHNSS